MPHLIGLIKTSVLENILAFFSTKLWRSNTGAGLLFLTNEQNLLRRPRLQHFLPLRCDCRDRVALSRIAPRRSLNYLWLNLRLMERPTPIFKLQELSQLFVSRSCGCVVEVLLGKVALSVWRVGCFLFFAVLLVSS